MTDTISAQRHAALAKASKARQKWAKKVDGSAFDVFNVSARNRINRGRAVRRHTQRTKHSA